MRARLAILNLSNNVTDYKTVASTETLYIARIFRMIGYDVDVISNKTTKNTVSFEEAFEPNEYFRVLVLNGAINFFGGSENPTIIKNYQFMSKFKQPILYLLTDLRLAYKPLWPSIQKRGWGYTEEEVTVGEVIIVSQAHNLNIVKGLHHGMKVIYAPLERYKVLFSKPYENNTKKVVDLIYGGSFRAGNREHEMIKYLFDTNYSVEFYGNAKLKQFKKYMGTKPPEFTGKIRAEDVIPYNDKAYASLVIGDKNYNGNMITLRVWEILLGNSIILIDDDFDPDHAIMKDDWFYVNTKYDIEIKIASLKRADNFDVIMDFQKRRLADLFDKEKFLINMEDILFHSKEDINEY